MPRLGEDRRLLVGLAKHLRDVRVPGHRAEVRIDAERADRFGETLDVFELQLLIDKREHLVLQPQRSNGRDLLVRERLAQVDAFDQRTARRRLRRHSELHRFPLRAPWAIEPFCRPASLSCSAGVRAGSGPMQDYEKLGVFYLGREYDAAARAPSEDLLLYDSRDLTTHAVCVGMTGSGKTGLCLALLEEAGIDGIPAICIDPKGDLGNLLLTFPAPAKPPISCSWVDPAKRSARA